MTNISNLMNFRGLCMQHGYNSKRLAEERGRGRLQDTGDFAG